MYGRAVMSLQGSHLYEPAPGTKPLIFCISSVNLICFDFPILNLGFLFLTKVTPSRT